MTDQLEQDIARGHHAERLLADEVLTGAFEKLKADYLAAWETSPARDTDGRERLWQAYQIVGKVRTELVNMVSDGTMAQRQVEAQQPK